MNYIRRLVRRKCVLSGESGLALVEVLIAVSIMAVTLTAFLGALSTVSISIASEQRNTTARILALSQLQNTRSQDYAVAPTTYPTVTPVPQGYVVTSNATAISGRDDNIQKITVTVQFHGTEVYSLEDFKVNR